MKTGIIYTVFTQTQDNPNLRRTQKINHIWQGKHVFIHVHDDYHHHSAPPTEMSAKKKYFAINLTELIYSISLPLPCHSHQLHLLCCPLSQSVPSFSSHSLLTFPSSSFILQLSLSVPSSAMDIQCFLQPCTVTSGEIYCHAMMVLWQRATHCTTALSALWMISSPQHLQPAAEKSLPQV